MKTIKKWMGISLGALLVGSGALAQTAQPFSIIVNGRLVSTGDQPPVVVRGSLLVPLAAIGNPMGAFLEWRAASKTVYGRMGAREFLLPVNSPTAVVNGGSQPVDPPAIISGGRTLVPLRFVATALGADVSYEADTKTVYIGQTGGAGTPTAPTTGPVTISRIRVTPNTPLKAGQSFTVRVNGTAGAKATYNVGSTQNLPLREVSAGVYEATYQVPANATFWRDVVTARLERDGTSREIQAAEPVVVDTQAPQIRPTSPKNGATVDTTMPYILADLDDRDQTGVAPESVKLFVNDEDVTLQASVTSDAVVYRETLEPGDVKVRVEAADNAGNPATAEWAFKVSGKDTATAPASPVITSPEDGASVSGKIIVRGTAVPGSSVRLRTTYRGTVLVVLSSEGEVNSQEIKVGSDGKWQSEEFELPSPSGVSNIRYTIAATTVTATDLSSEPTIVTLRRR